MLELNGDPSVGNYVDGVDDDADEKNESKACTVVAFGCSRLDVRVWKFAFGRSRSDVRVWMFAFGCSHLDGRIWMFAFA